MVFLAKVLLLFALAVVAASQNIPTGTSTQSISFGGRTRSYIVNRPSGNPDGLMLVFHGYTQSASSICSQTNASSIGAANNFVTVCPSGIGNSWNAGLCCGGNTQDDVGFSRAVVSQVRGAVSSVQGSKVFTSGFSNGGMLSMRLVCQASDVFQGALNAGGQYYGTPYFGYSCSSSVNRQVLHLHGTADSVIGWNGANNAYQAYVSQIQGCPSSFSTIYTNPAYFNMQCWERRPCSGSTASTFCSYTGMGHIWPANGLLRGWNYFTTGRLS